MENNKTEVEVVKSWWERIKNLRFTFRREQSQNTYRLDRKPRANHGWERTYEDDGYCD